jgi:hypothetical protein
MDHELPLDVAEDILSAIDSSAALRSFALTCTFWANQIIPRHIQYRTLTLGLPDTRTADVWAHLAKRKDLAKNIRDVYLMNTRPEYWRCPTSLVTIASDDLQSEREAIHVEALENMESLERFSWQPSDFGIFPLDDKELASALGKSRTLTHLSIYTDDAWINISGHEDQNHPVRY